MSILRALRRWWHDDYGHHLPGPDTAWERLLDPDRCMFCLMHEDSAAWMRPCSRRRPSKVELA